MSKRIRVGAVEIGGGAAVSVQSMTNTKTEDVEASVQQLRALQQAGCDIVRLAVPTHEAARALARIRETVPDLPLVADIHFDYRLALEALEAGVDKIRINPGNIGGEEQVRAVARACAQRGVPIRIGINSGSVEKRLLEKYGGPTPRAMLESALYHVELLHRFDFDDICLSLKSSSVRDCVACYRLAAQETDYPLHIGVTEAGAGELAVVKSAAGIGALLLEGIGDTLRVSLTGDPLREVRAGIEILRAVGLRRSGVEIVSCPTCGRTEIDLEALVRDVEAGLRGCTRPVKVAVMGCVVNGPGEAREADYGIAGGKGVGVLFRRGERLETLPYDRLAEALCALVLGEDGR